jgi:glycosyltransferase involved in cell wall biosynthesis
VATPRAESWLILTQYYAPEIGAPQIRLRSVVRELRARGIDVEVLTGMPNYPAGVIHPGYRGRWRMREVIDGVPVRRTWLYPATGKSARARLANYFSFTATALIAALLGKRPTVMFVESQPLSLGVVALLMKWVRGVPYVYNVPDLQIDVARELGFMQSRLVFGLALRLENMFLKQSWRVSTVTDRFIDHFQSRGVRRSQITFLPNGADTTFLRPLPASTTLLDRWQLHGKKVFAYVGTHAFYHGLDTLLDAATELRADPDIAILMIGNGPERERLKALAAARGLRNVIFGESPYEEMDQLYSIAYASVATLRDVPVAHGMRLSKIFPSLSCGVPVIYSGRGEAAELLVKEQCGLIVAPEDSRALADVMRRLTHDPRGRDALGRRGRAFVEREYSWSAIVSRWLRELGVTAPALPAVGGDVSQPSVASS